MAIRTVTNRVHSAIVTGVRVLSPGMVRITFGGDSLRTFESTGVGDEYLRVFLPHERPAAFVLPYAEGDYWDYAEGVEPLPMRTYTVRAHRPEAGEVDIDFVFHDGGIAATWAAAAKPGDVVGVNSPRGLYDAPVGIEWQLLLADSTGLPAAARLIENAPDGVLTRVILEVPGPDHRQELVERPGVTVTWVYGGNGHTRSRLAELLATLELPAGAGYVWAAGETRILRDIRRDLRHGRKLPATNYKLMGYWTDRAEEWSARYDELDPSTRAGLDALWESGEDLEVIEDRYDSMLTTLGL
ncbi:MAG: siderophore-interacting protein [Agromyces sp.]